MATYTWRVANGDLGLAADWQNNTTGENPASTTPSTPDIAAFNGPGGTVTGAATYAQLAINHSNPALWTFTGPIATASAAITGLAAIGSGGRLTVAPPTAPTGYPLTIGTILQGGAGLTVSSGGVVESSLYGAFIGGIAGGVGSLTVTAGGVAKLGTLSNTAFAALAVGRDGTGTVSVSGPGAALQLTGGFYAGRAVGSSGTVAVSNGATLTEISSGTPTENVGIGASGTSTGTLSSGGTGAFTLTTAATASIVSPVLVGSSGSTGTLLIADPGTSLTLGDNLNVGTGGAAPGGTGTVNVQNAGLLKFIAAADTSRSLFGLGTSVSTNGTATITGTGSLIDVGPNAASIGNTGAATLTISGGGTFRAATADGGIRAALSAGNAPGSSATITVTGIGSTLTASGYDYIGRAGSASLLVDQGATFTGGQAASGDGIGPNRVFAIAIGDGTPSFDSNGTANSPLYFGGTATARVLNASTLASLGNLNVGRRGSTGTLLVDSASRVTVANQTIVGSSTDGNGAPDRPGAVGTITIQGGSTLKTGTVIVNAQPGLLIGAETGNTGTVTVTGQGSRLDAGLTRITVGNTSSGTLNVLAGAVATAGAGYTDIEAALHIGSSATGIGTATVSGAGSQLLAAGQAVLGGYNNGTGLTAGGTGTLSVTGGGLFRTTQLASFAGSTLTIDTTGTGVVGTGAGTAGRLTIEPGRTVTGAGKIAATVIDNGTITATGGTLEITALDRASTGTLAFTGRQATIKLGTTPGTITATGFAAGDVLDLAALPSATLSGTTLSFTGGSITLTGLPQATTLTVAPDGQGGTKLVGTDTLFDAAYYLAKNPDVKAAGIDPYQHYLASGYKEGRDPSALFNTNYYLTQNPDVAAAGLNPLLHFETSGYAEGRNPAANFSLTDYLAANPDVKAAGIDPLLHYVASGRAEGRSAFPVGPGPHPRAPLRHRLLLRKQPRRESRRARRLRPLSLQRLQGGPRARRLFRRQILPHAKPRREGRRHRPARPLPRQRLQGRPRTQPRLLRRQIPGPEPRRKSRRPQPPRPLPRQRPVRRPGRLPRRRHPRRRPARQRLVLRRPARRNPAAHRPRRPNPGRRQLRRHRLETRPQPRRPVRHDLLPIPQPRRRRRQDQPPHPLRNQRLQRRPRPLCRLQHQQILRSQRRRKSRRPRPAPPLPPIRPSRRPHRLHRLTVHPERPGTPSPRARPGLPLARRELKLDVLRQKILVRNMPLFFPDTNEAEDPHEVRKDDRAFYRAILHEMIQAGIDQIRTIQFRASTSAIEGRQYPADTAIGFERVTRAVRRTIMLAEKLAETPLHTEPKPAKPTRPNPTDSPEPPESDAEPNAEPDDRDRDRDDAQSRLPIPQQIAAIRDDLGLPPLPECGRPARPTEPKPTRPTTPKPTLTQPKPTPTRPPSRKATQTRAPP